MRTRYIALIVPFFLFSPFATMFAYTRVPIIVIFAFWYEFNI